MNTIFSEAGEKSGWFWAVDFRYSLTDGSWNILTLEKSGGNLKLFIQQGKKILLKAPGKYLSGPSVWRKSQGGARLILRSFFADIRFKSLLIYDPYQDNAILLSSVNPKFRLTSYLIYHLRRSWRQSYTFLKNTAISTPPVLTFNRRALFVFHTVNSQLNINQIKQEKLCRYFPT